MNQQHPAGGDALILFQRVYALLGFAPWRDRRHALTWCWMVVGLLLSGKPHPAAWSTFRRVAGSAGAES